MNFLPQENLSYPLRIEIGDFQATGFLLNIDNINYLVTAAHTFYDEDDGELINENFKVFAYTDDINNNLIWEFSGNIPELEKHGNILTHDDQDVTVIRFALTTGELSAQVFKGITINSRQKDKVCTIPGTSIATVDKVKISCETYVLGYPSAIGLEDLPQIDFERPLVKRGSVAGINFDKKTIILDCDIYKGNSGGPVLQGYQSGIGHYKMELIGMIVEFVPIENQLETTENISGVTTVNSGYSIALSVDIIQETINNFTPLQKINQ